MLPLLCTHCNRFENGKHFISQCPAYQSERQSMLMSNKNNVDEAMFNLFISNLDFAICTLLGDHDDIFINVSLSLSPQHRQNDVYFSSSVLAPMVSRIKGVLHLFLCILCVCFNE